MKAMAGTRWKHKRTGEEYLVDERVSIHVGAQTWEPGVKYSRCFQGSDTRIGGFVRTDTDFLDSFLPTEALP